ncbi:MAG: class I SAM-dependent methyltransferase [Candidatus Pacebacteria bacterium]|nr:class I SAM-dependent methyltransferase [Candidatus Paceibacterota bacterium]
MQNIKIFKTVKWEDYELLDTGEGEKLERFGDYTFVRPYEDAFWKKTLDKKIWNKANGEFLTSKESDKSGWRLKNKIENDFILSLDNISWISKPTPFRHLQFFPEQRVHWEFIAQKIKQAKRPIKFLNLFGYTGVASLFALSAGAEVVHVDASKGSIDLAKENQKLSKLNDKPMRVIVDDVLKFLEREIKRGNKYDAIIMDPPKFGRGPKGETWKIERDLPKLISLVERVLSPNPLFVILTSYAIESSSLSLGYSLENIKAKYGGNIEAGEMCIEESSSGRLISLANTAVWQK